MSAFLLDHKKLVQDSVSTQTTYIKKAFLKEEKTMFAPKLRGSALPICSVLVLRDLLLQEQKIDLRQDYYMSIGTLVHSIFQRWAVHEHMTFGDWMCSVCKKEIRNSLMNKCCDKDMQYKEIEIKFGGISGHVDMVVVEDGKYHIHDFKTCGSEKLKSGDLATAKYKIQIFTYTWIFEKIYQVEMGGPSLIFISRDNPMQFKEVKFRWNDRIRYEIGKFLHSQVLSYKSALQAFKERNVSLAIKNRMCRDVDHYNSNCKSVFFDGCPLKNICIDAPTTKHLETYLNQCGLND